MPSRTKKFRGLRTHGRGNAGLHKYKIKSVHIYAPDHFGRHGFQRPPELVERPKSLNVGDLDSVVPLLQAVHALSREGEAWVADLAKIGVDRLLGGGRVHGTWKVYVPHASGHAREKVTVLDAPPTSEPPTAVP